MESFRHPFFALSSACSCPGLGLADQAAQRAAFQLEISGALQGDAAAVGLAVLGIVDLPVPLIGRAAWLHAEYDLNANDRPVALAGVRIVLVGLGTPSRGVIGILQGNDRSAELGTATRDAD